MKHPGRRDEPLGRRGGLLALLVALALTVLAAPASAQTGALAPEAAPPPAPPAASPPPPPVPAPDQVLSDETRRSQWAFVVAPTWALAQPDADAKRVKRLDRYVPDTESRELVLVLRQRTLPNGAVWVQVRLPMRPNNRTGWLPRASLGAFRPAKGHLLIERRRFRATLFDARGRRVWTSRIGVGQPRWPTPAGRFYIRERLFVPPGSARKVYGPFAFGTSAHSATLSGGNWGEGVIGVHGTGSPGLLPGRVSHGCVRVPNDAILRLRRLMPLGTPVRIR